MALGFSSAMSKLLDTHPDCKKYFGPSNPSATSSVMPSFRNPSQLSTERASASGKEPLLKRRSLWSMSLMSSSAGAQASTTSSGAGAGFHNLDDMGGAGAGFHNRDKRDDLDFEKKFDAWMSSSEPSDVSLASGDVSTSGDVSRGDVGANVAGSGAVGNTGEDQNGGQDQPVVDASSVKSGEVTPTGEDLIGPTGNGGVKMNSDGMGLASVVSADDCLGKTVDVLFGGTPGAVPASTGAAACTQPPVLGVPECKYYTAGGRAAIWDEERKCYTVGGRSMPPGFQPSKAIHVRAKAQCMCRRGGAQCLVECHSPGLTLTACGDLLCARCHTSGGNGAVLCTCDCAACTKMQVDATCRAGNEGVKMNPDGMGNPASVLPADDGFEEVFRELFGDSGPTGNEGANMDSDGMSNPASVLPADIGLGEAFGSRGEIGKHQEAVG